MGVSDQADVATEMKERLKIKTVTANLKVIIVVSINMHVSAWLPRTLRNSTGPPPIYLHCRVSDETCPMTSLCCQHIRLIQCGRVVADETSRK
jgi:hypothetical protein